MDESARLEIAWASKTAPRGFESHPLRLKGWQLIACQPLFFIPLILLACSHPKPWKPVHHGLKPQVFVLSVAENSSGLWAAVYSDPGLYFSPDGGQSWQPVKEGIPPGPTFSLKPDPSNPKAIYVGTSEGVARCEASPPSCRQVGVGLPIARIYALAFSSDGTLYASPDEAPIHRLRGEQWEPLSPLKATALTLLPHPSHPFTLLAGTAGQGIWKTEDGGLSWHNVSGKSGARHVYALAANPSKPYEIFAGAKEGLFLSKDGGETWEKFPSPFSVPTALLFSSDGSLYAGEQEANPALGRFGVYRSQDGGNSWERLEGFPPTASIFTLAEGPSGLYAGGIQGLFKVSGTTATWEEVKSGPGGPLILGIALSPQGNALYAMTGKGLYVSSDEGENWTPLLEGWGVQSIAFHPHDPETFYIGVIGHGVWMGGKWEPISFSLAGLSIPFLLIDPYNPDYFYARISYDRLYRSSDGGRTFKSIWEGMKLSDEVLCLAYDYNNPGTLLAGATENLYITRNRGDSWEIMPGPFQGQSILTVAFHPTKAGQIYVGATRGLYVSHDYGLTWQTAGFQDVTVSAIAFDPRNHDVIYIGTRYSGLFRSRDGGNTWDFIADGLPLEVRQVLISPRGTIFVRTPDGIYRSAQR